MILFVNAAAIVGRRPTIFLSRDFQKHLSRLLLVSDQQRQFNFQSSNKKNR
jgi:hypothetical protein